MSYLLSTPKKLCLVNIYGRAPCYHVKTYCIFNVRIWQFKDNIHRDFNICMILHNFCMSLNIHIYKIYTNHNVVLTCGKSEISTRFKECKYCCVQLLTYASTALILTTNITTGKCCPHTSRCIIISVHGILMFHILQKLLCYIVKTENLTSIKKHIFP